MLQLQSKELDIGRISKLLVKHNVKASVSCEVITLDGEISDELLSQICNGISICSVQNFSGEISTTTQKETILSNVDECKTEKEENSSIDETPEQEVILAPRLTQDYNLIYPTVKRGEVYLCDLGEPFGSEQGYKRYAIIVQNDDGNLYSPTTIVLSCTTEYKKRLPVHHHFTFSNKNMIDYNSSRIRVEPNIVMAEQINTVDKKRLRKFLGTMTPEFMDKIQEIIDVSLALKRKEKVLIKTEKVTEKVYIDKPVIQNAQVDSSVYKEFKNLNMVQLQLLAFVDVKELFKIHQTKASDEIKTEKTLELFGFDMQQKGVQYLFKAILISSKNTYFNLESLSRIISEEETDIEKNEIKRLIIARVKERFKFKKSPALDFIRIVNCFLTNKED